jgi:hypothetical protein
LPGVRAAALEAGALMAKANDLRAQLDALIDAYADSGRTIELAMTPAQLGKLLACAPRPGSANQFNYRGHTIVATGFDAVRARFLGGL